MFEKEIKTSNSIENLKEATVFLLLVLLIIIFRLYVITPASIQGESMMPTLNDRDLVFLKKYDKTYNRFDIIVHNYGNTKLVKRIIALPGEHVAYRDSVLYINHEPVEEDFLDGKTDDFDLRKLDHNRIPEGYYFVLGDNRNFSQDSRVIGLIAEENILGKTNFRFYPFKQIGRIN